MRTTIEVSSRAIRLCREEKKRITLIETYPVPPGADPLSVLESSELPTPLGNVRLVMNHGDMLLRTMVQPPCPLPRLDKIVKFELQSAADAEPVVSSWHLVAGMGSGDMRILTMVTKRKLLNELRHSLKAHKGHLESLVHPAIGLYHAYRALGREEQGPSMLVDVGGTHLHLVLLLDGELLFLRSQTAGMDDLVKQVCELRSLTTEDARALIEKIGKGAPADLHELINRQVSSIAGVLTSNVRFAKAQLRLDQFEPKNIWLAGAGAQVYGFKEALAQRMGTPVCPINPFVRLTKDLPKEKLDALAALPSPWTVALGAARDAVVELDAMQEDRNQRAYFWRTEGALRVAAGFVLILLLATLVRQQFSARAVQSTIDILSGTNGGGYVPQAEQAAGQLKAFNNDKVDETKRLMWLDGERRPGRIALEVLNAFEEQNDPVKCPVYLKNFKVTRETHQVLVDLTGYVQGVGKLGSDSVLRMFEQGLIKRYAPITAIHQKPVTMEPNRQSFEYIITIADQNSEIGQVKHVTEDGQSKLKVSVQIPPGIDQESAARVAAIRARTTETMVVVSVSPLVQLDEKAGKGASADFTVSF